MIRKVLFSTICILFLSLQGFCGVSFDFPNNIGTDHRDDSKVEFMPDNIEIFQDGSFIRIKSAEEIRNIQWYFNGEKIKNNSTIELWAEKSGKYSVSGILKDGKEHFSSPIIIAKHHHFFDQVFITPNPIKKNLVIKIDKLEQDLLVAEIYNLVGEKLNEVKVKKETEIDFSQFEKGYYFLKLINKNKTMVKKILKI